MKKIMFLILFIFFISGCSTGNVIYDSSKDSSLKLEGPFKVVNVVDGDTLDINISERVRLSGINTPETGECYYQEAKDKLKELTLNKVVYLEKDISDRGNYGRLLRYIYVNDLFLNSFLVEQGYAKVYDKYEADTKRYDELKKVEAVAIEKNIGVWSCIDPKAECLYVASKNSEIYHKPNCKYAKKISPENLICFKSLDEVIEKGLIPCKTCNP